MARIHIPKFFFRPKPLPADHEPELNPEKEKERERVEMTIQRDVAVVRHVSSAIRESLMRDVIAEVRRRGSTRDEHDINHART